MDGEIAPTLMAERLRECDEVQDPITTAKRAALVGEEVDVLIDRIEDGQPIGRTYREAPEIDGIVRILGENVFARPGATVRATISGVEGPDLDAKVGA
jgi:ribosomal protein S12 methylthiotransferase